MEPYIEKLFYMSVNNVNDKAIEEYCEKNKKHIIAAIKRMFPRHITNNMRDFKYNSCSYLIDTFKIYFDCKINWYEKEGWQAKKFEFIFIIDLHEYIKDIFYKNRKVEILTINIYNPMTGEMRQRNFDSNFIAISVY